MFDIQVITAGNHRQNPMVVPLICLIAAVSIAAATSLWTTHNRPIPLTPPPPFADKAGYFNNPATTSAPGIAANIAIDGIYRERLQRTNQGDPVGMIVNCSPKYTMAYLSQPLMLRRYWESDTCQFFSHFAKVTVSGSVLSFLMQGHKATTFIMYRIEGVAGKDQRVMKGNLFPAARATGKQPLIPVGSRYSEERQQKDVWQWQTNRWVNTSSRVVASRIMVDGKPLLSAVQR